MDDVDMMELPAPYTRAPCVHIPPIYWMDDADMMSDPQSSMAHAHGYVMRMHVLSICRLDAEKLPSGARIRMRMH